jgi:hypothetical protein
MRDRWVDKLVRPSAQIELLERLLRVIAAAGSVTGASWGIQWILRAGDPFGREGVLQLLFSFVVTVDFAVRLMGRRTERWFWVHTTLLSAIWVWRSDFKHYPAGVATFSISGGLAIVGFLLATWRHRAAQQRVAADWAAPDR